MCFTMKYAYHSDYKTIFTKTIEKEGRIHALIPKGKPWKNGFIERSNRTDKENLFNQIRFIDSDDRKYQLKLWEMEYNNSRPHQGINNLTPMQKAQKQHPVWYNIVMGIT